MNKLTVTGLVFLSFSGLAVAAEQAEPESKSQCVYQGQVYGIGAPVQVNGKTIICVRKNNQMKWLSEDEAQHYL